MKTMKKIFYLIVIALIVAQFFQPEKNEGSLASVEPFYNETKPSEEVKTILKTACFDCHSDTTNYPWYSKITPVNYWLAEHIEDGKKHLNFSNWVGNSVKRKDHKMDELIEEIEEHKMPLESYTLIHKDAKLSESQIEAVTTWAKMVRVSYGIEALPEY
ncbi:cytochrome C [Tamlana sedimentorum]|uniref:Cytochrome C n=2 Tax=Neotamlana sedimentorum TaxID=1435349 RepID=A0A0D7W2G8_9FLAO|nr:cytochrome C [Tamlana sedimentorum]